MGIGADLLSLVRQSQGPAAQVFRILHFSDHGGIRPVFSWAEFWGNHLWLWTDKGGGTLSPERTGSTQEHSQGTQRASRGGDPDSGRLERAGRRERAQRSGHHQQRHWLCLYGALVITALQGSTGGGFQSWESSWGCCVLGPPCLPGCLAWRELWVVALWDRSKGATETYSVLFD